jgi:hypothetical protein
MAFALKASSPAALGHPGRCGAAAVVTVPKRFTVRAVAATTSAASLDPAKAVAMSTPGRFVVRAPRLPPVADGRALSVSQTLSRIKEQGKVLPLH